MTRMHIQPIILVLSLTLCLFTSCKREEEIEGPVFITAPENLEILSFNASPSAIDFSSDSVVFNATFSHTVSWILTIKGSESEAVKEFRGLDDNINDLTWKGRHDGINFFKKGEKAIATLSFLGTNKKIASSDITISVARDYTSYGFFPEGGDFEDAALVGYPTWAKFAMSDQNIGSVEKDLSGKLVRPVQGNNYYYLRDKPVKNAQFVDGIRFDYSGFLPGIPADPDNVWVNIYIYGTGNKTTQMNFEFKEEDVDKPTPGHQDAEDDAMVATIFPSHTGWKLYSFKYSNLSPGASAQFGGSGNKIHEPNRIVSIQFALLKTGDRTKQTELYFDFPIITVGGPFDPSK